MALLITSLLLNVGVKNTLLSRVLGAHGRSEHRACRTLDLEKRIYLRRQRGLRKSYPGGYLGKSSWCEKSETQPIPQEPQKDAEENGGHPNVGRQRSASLRPQTQKWAPLFWQ